MSKSTAVAKAADASVPVDSEQTLKACKALVAHIKKAATTPRSDGKQNLLADEESTVSETPVWLTLTTKKHIHDSHRLQPGKIVLPHPLNSSEELSVCLITADPQRWYKNAVADGFPEDLRTKIGRVIDISHLRAKFKTFEAQRKLFSEHDVFLADDRIINRLPKALGKTFYKSTVKRPIPVVLMAQRAKIDGKRVPAPKGKKTKRDPAENVNARPIPEIVSEVQKAIGAALVHLSPSTNTAVKVGYASWEPEKLAANIETLVRELVERFVPKKWQNVRNIYIKGPETAALPVYQTDELWLDESKVVPDGQQPPSALPGKHREKPNIGKKRKLLDAEPEPAAEEAVTEEGRKKKVKKALPESNDDKLDKEIAERKAKLRKQKTAAKKKVDI
ncbi:ribosomal protein L1p/L10e family-domain-containing protein [Chaetomium strumarium]|uniref:Ribosomal protein L1p/L10e family-domain-containing protein n=1 Tax=Chaetomium strumarium TaxID=1170767 RepID=A0AAJ0GW41_9PEZI|nr:ribosomal protein L1p/L10e family-domain-containing protein [Chaetomium strumarium]